MRSLLGVASVLLLAGTVQGQALEQRVARAPDGEIRLSYAARPGVYGDGRNITTRVRGHDAWGWPCDSGPVRVALTKQGGAVTRVRAYVGGAWRPGAAVTDLATVAAAEAARYLLSLPHEQAIFAATLADSVTVWPDLLRLAREEQRPRRVRRAAVFWLGQAAEDAATRGLDELVGAEAVDGEVREAAVFALSQRPRDEGVPALIRIVRTHRDPEIRRKALFWLGQSEDPRALALLEELLTRR
ncbi:MAG: HEAT repeat domain-containing protein [Gemmatimonadales bacterium]